MARVMGSVVSVYLCLSVCLLLLLDLDRLYYTEDSLRPDEKEGGWEGT